MGAGLVYETRRVPAQELLPTGDQYPVRDTKVEDEIERWSREESRRENKHQRINKIRVYSGIG